MKKYRVRTVDENGIEEEIKLGFVEKIVLWWTFSLYRIAVFLFGEERMAEGLGERGVTATNIRKKNK